MSAAWKRGFQPKETAIQAFNIISNYYTCQFSF